MKNKEIWKKVLGYEDDYEVSSFGRVRSSKRNKDKKILKAIKTNNGYSRTFLCRIDEETNQVVRKGYYIHRLVATAFLRKPKKEKTQVNHLNGIKTDNHYKNLEWCSPLENIKHARLNGLFRETKKSWDNPRSVAIQQIDIVKNSVVATFGSIGEASKETNIDVRCISQVVREKRKQAGGFLWKKVSKNDIKRYSKK